jgi:isopenicillin N synthase-like dioxygenase
MTAPNCSDDLPIIDLTSLISGEAHRDEAIREISEACKNVGFFYIVGHGLDPQLFDELERLSSEFFARPLEEKMGISMSRGGRAWRGFFPVGAELTSGQADQKEGLYLGEELGPEHPKVKGCVPLHGANLFPDIPGFRELVLEILSALTRLGHVLMEGIALSLGLEASYFYDRYSKDPLILFRIFHYPALPIDTQLWGVGEHTDYGILTILRQDQSGGLQVRSRKNKRAWIDAPPIENSFVVNIGDMLERMTGGLYKSTAHRVLNTSESSRLSFPFFFDPNFDVEVKPIFPGQEQISHNTDERWDRASVHDIRGSYGDYVLNKVSKVFPMLRDNLETS